MKRYCVKCGKFIDWCLDLCEECMIKAYSFKKQKCILCEGNVTKNNHIFCEECYNKYVVNNISEYFMLDDLYIEMNQIARKRYKTQEEKFDNIGKLYNIRNQIKQVNGDNTILFDDFLARCYDILHQEETDYGNNVWLTTKDGDQVRSRGELIIDNYLYDNNISHEYEKSVYINRIELRPDFYLPEYDVYIEYWGYDENSQDREIADAYEQRKLEKQELYKQGNITLIEIENKDFENIYLTLDNKFKELPKNELPF